MVARDGLGSAVRKLFLVVLAGGATAAPTCRMFEAYLQCGEPVEEFRNSQMDLGCDDFVVGAGYCVCSEPACSDEANWIRVEIDCAPPDLTEEQDAGIGAGSRTCTALCGKYESNMWVYGVVSSVGASCATAGGLIIQKMAQDKFLALAEDERPYSLGGFIFAPLWMTGFLLISLVPLPFNLMAVTFAAASLVAPLASVTLVLNQVLAPIVLGEKLSRADVVGTVVIVGGVVLATIYGSHCESSYTADDLLELYTRAPFLVVAALCVVASCTALAVIKAWRQTLPDHISKTDLEAMDDGAPTRVCIAYAFMAGTMGALMQIVFKGTGELIGAGEFGHWALWMSIALVIILATTQMSYLNQGMAVCTAVVFFPTYNACFIVMTTLTGITYYEEYKTLTGVKVWACFAGGVTCVMIGVLVLTRKTTAKVVDLAAAESESQQSCGEVLVEDLLAGTPQVAVAASAGGSKQSTSPVLVQTRSATPARDRKPTAVRLAQLSGERRGSFSTLMVTSSGILIPPSPTTSNGSGGGFHSRPGSRNISPAKQRSLVGPPRSRSNSGESVAETSPHDLGAKLPQSTFAGSLPNSLDSGIKAGMNAGGAPLPTIPGGDTPLASLTAEDAAAFMALSAAQRERAGKLSQEELDASIQRALQRGEFDDRLLNGEGSGQAAANPADSDRQGPPKP